MKFLGMWETWASLAIAAGCICGGIAFTTGRWDGARRVYDNGNLPFFLRNVHFALIPYGLVFAMWIALFALAELGQDLVGAAIGYGSFLVAAIGIFFTARPPNFLKPPWLREREASRTE